MRFHEAVHLSPELDKISATEELVKTMEKMMRTYSKDIFWMHDRWKIKRRNEDNSESPTLTVMKVIQILPELESGGVERGTLEVGQHLTEQGTRIHRHLQWR